MSRLKFGAEFRTDVQLNSTNAFRLPTIYQALNCVQEEKGKAPCLRGPWSGEEVRSVNG